MTKRCNCEHWEICPVCYPQGFNPDGTKKIPEIPPTREQLLARISTLETAIYRMKVAGGREEFQRAFELAKDLVK